MENLVRCLNCLNGLLAPLWTPAAISPTGTGYRTLPMTWSSYLKYVCANDLRSRPNGKIGEPNKIVEADESLFTHLGKLTVNAM